VEIASVHLGAGQTGYSLGTAEPNTLQVQVGSKRGASAEVLPLEQSVPRRRLCGSDAAVGREAGSNVG